MMKYTAKRDGHNRTFLSGKTFNVDSTFCAYITECTQRGFYEKSHFKTVEYIAERTQ